MFTEHQRDRNVCLLDWSVDYSDYLSLHLGLMRDSLLCMVNEAGTVGGYIKNRAHFKVARSVEQLTRHQRRGLRVVLGWLVCAASGVMEGKKEKEG